MPATLTIPLGSKEYIKAPVTSDVDLVAQTVEIRYDGTTWLPGTWGAASVLAAGKYTRTVRTTTEVTFSTAGIFHVFVRLTDSPEVPIMKAGDITVG